MGDVISFEKRKKKEEKFNSSKKKSKMTAEKATCESNRIDVDYADMEPDDQIEYWKNKEKEDEERFKCKYSDVLVAVPISAGEKMQYFANIMLQLLPDVFHGGWDTRFDTWMDFCEFYITEFAPAYSDYLNSNKEFEKSYSYNFKPISEEKLEEDLKDCLKKLVALYPEKNDEYRTAMMYQAERLFELQDLVTDLFILEVTND